MHRTFLGSHAADWATEMEGGLITLGDVTFREMAEGLENGWLIRIDEHHCSATEALRKVIEDE